MTAGVLLAAACADGEDGRPGGTESPRDSGEVAREVETMLRGSAGSWNDGDLEGFLDDYTADSTLTFVGATGVIRGLDEVRERYRRTYWAPGRTRDSLRFEDVRVRPLGPDHALATGRYVLYRPAPADTVTGSGRFSLVLRREARGWQIFHDHTTAVPDPGGEAAADPGDEG